MKFKPGDIVLVKPFGEAKTWETVILSIRKRRWLDGTLSDIYESYYEKEPTITQCHKVSVIDDISELVGSISEETLGLLLLKHYGK